LLDGTVKIDQDAVETLAFSKADRTMSPVAEVMLATGAPLQYGLNCDWPPKRFR
jgi:hypothetical protein